MKYTEAAIYNITGKVPLFYRPPYGDMDDRTRAITSALGYKLVSWEYDDMATNSGSLTNQQISDQFVGWIFKSSKGFISLHHDISPKTASVGLGILDWYSKQTTQFKIKPIGECLKQDWYRQPPVPSPSPKPIQSTPSPTPRPSDAFTTSMISTHLVIVSLIFSFYLL